MSGWRPQGGDEWPTLGFEVIRWIETNCVIPDGQNQGQPYVLTPEMGRFVLKFFRLHPNAQSGRGVSASGAFAYRGAQLMRPMKWGKSPLAAALCLAHAFGPVIFDGWDAAGQPVGRPHPTPWIQIVANSEEQSDNVWLAVYEMAVRGAVATLPGVDIGLRDINLPSGGKIEPRSASARARLGARLTFAAFDESGLMNEGSGGLLLATTMKRNLSAMGGRWLETTNAYDPSEDSVAQRTQESPAKDVLIDYPFWGREGYEPPHRPELTDSPEARVALAVVYGDSHWVDLERVLADARDPAVCPYPQDAYRYFFNRLEVGVTDAVDPTRWDAKAKDADLQPGQAITLGFDGSRPGKYSSSSTALVACRVEDGRWFLLRLWDPVDYADGKIPRAEVDQAINDAFEAYDVKYLYGYADQWQEFFDIWAGRWPKRIVDSPTNVDRRMDVMIRRFQEIFAGNMTHDGSPKLAAHAKAAAFSRGGRKKPMPEDDQSVPQHYLRVVKKRDGGHIDAFIAGLQAEAARGQALEDGKEEPEPEPEILVTY